MKQIIGLLALFVPYVMHAQPEPSKGIKWADSLSWKQVIAKAKSENKNIFLDCYATWCAPCKAMDKNIYSNDTVGNVMNAKFISVKVQMDQTSFDDEQVKKWYPRAADLKSAYSISAFPSYLFLSPEGKPLHKSVGYKSVKAFLDMADDATNPGKQYYSILNNFQPGKIDTAEEKGLSRGLLYTDKNLAAKIGIDYLTRIPKKELAFEDNLQLMAQLNENEVIQNMVISYFRSLPSADLAQSKHVLLINTFSKNQYIREIIVQYLKSMSLHGFQLPINRQIAIIYSKDSVVKDLVIEYIKNLPEESLFNEGNIELLNSFTSNSNDIGFKIFYNNQQRIDLIMTQAGKQANVFVARNYSQYLIDKIILKEEVNPYLTQVDKGTAESIPWKVIRRNIKKKYSSEYAERNIIQSKSNVYRYLARKYNSHWTEYINYALENLEKYADTTNSYLDAANINDFAWNDVFFHSTTKKQLIRAANLMQGVVRRNPGEHEELDTYANLLYKIGRKQDAIEIEQKALRLAMEQNWPVSTRTYQNIIEKMKRDEPTWIVSKN